MLTRPVAGVSSFWCHPEPIWQALPPLSVTCYNQTMIQVRNEVLETTLEATFSSAVHFDPVLLKAVATKALEKFSKYDLRPNQVIQRTGDQLFDYVLAFNLFNNQATFRLVADKLTVRIQGAKSKQDAQILAETLILSGECIETKVERINVQALAHAAFDVEAEGLKFFEAFTDKSNHIVDGGRIVIVKHPDWQESVRITVERSLASKNGIFLCWMTEQNGPVSLESIKMIADKFGKALNSVGLNYRVE
jgi:hypothetical protein